MDRKPLLPYAKQKLLQHENHFQKRQQSKLKFMSRYFENVTYPPQPTTLDELKSRLERIKGFTLGELASALDLPCPTNSTKAKGYAGELVELLLGADANNLPVPDFTHLGIELKTMPINRDFEPLETTYLCHAPLTSVRGIDFFSSVLYAKVRMILFVFILAEREMNLPDRRIIDYYLFAPDEHELAQIKADYDELMDMVTEGQAQQITARIGTMVQMRPKCADGRQVVPCVTADGSFGWTRPRGFYLRRDFNQNICRRVAPRHLLPLPLKLS